MKKFWQKPTLEVLDLKMTMGSTEGTTFDNDYSAGQEVPFDDGKPSCFS